jgi:dUTP pyrophosphatase
MNSKVQFVKIHSDAKIPTKAHVDDAGMDFYAIEDVEVYTGCKGEVKTGLIFQMGEEGGWKDYTYYLQLKDKSSIAMQGVHLVAGVVDYGYRGEVTGIVSNFSPGVYTFKKGQKAFQGIVFKIPKCEIEEVMEVVRSERGSGGFGSSGSF